MGVGAVIAQVDGIFRQAAVVEYVSQAHAGKHGAADCAGGPLIPTGGGHKFAAPVAAAFQLQLQGDFLKTAAQIGDRE